MILSIPKDLPLLYDKNRRTFMLTLSILIGLLYLTSILSNGVYNFIKSWQFQPEQESYVLIPYSGHEIQLEHDTQKIESFLKNSTLVKDYKRVDEESFQRMFNASSSTDNVWLESIPFPVFIELNLKSSAPEKILLIESQIREIVPDAQIYFHPRYAPEFVSSFKIFNYLLNTIIACFCTAFVAVLVLMTRFLFVQQSKNIERLSLLGATPSYIKKLYCGFMARCVALSAVSGFAGACTLCWVMYLVSEHVGFFPYSFSLPSTFFYFFLFHLCLVIGVCVTYIVVNSMLKKLWACV